MLGVGGGKTSELRVRVRGVLGRVVLEPQENAKTRHADPTLRSTHLSHLSRLFATVERIQRSTSLLAA